LKKNHHNCYGPLFCFAWSVFAFAWSIGVTVSGEFRWGRRSGSIIRPDTHPYFFWGIVAFWFVMGVVVGCVGIKELRAYLRRRRIEHEK
jgi:hypothetical protein